MPNLTTTIEDTSPVIIYSNDWRMGSSSNDTSTDQYSQSSFMVTNVSQAQFSFTFYGVGVQLFGAKRENHGSYQISIDSRLYPVRDGSSSDPLGVFQTSLFTTAGLQEGYHTVRLTNMENAYVDLDFITWQTRVGLDNEVLLSTTFQDWEPSFEYTPASQWTSDPPNLGMYSGGSGHLTYTSGASAQFQFRGIKQKLFECGAVALYGPVGPNCATYSVSLDGGTPLNYSANKAFYRPKQLLYQASNLGGNEHALTIRPESGINSTVYFAIDYAEVFTTPSLNGSASGKLSAAQIAGTVVGSVVGLALLGSLVLLLLRRSKYAQYFPFKQKEDANAQTLTVEPFQYNDLPTGTTFSGNQVQTYVAPQPLKNQLSQEMQNSRRSPTSLIYQPDLSPSILATPGGQSSYRDSGSSGVEQRLSGMLDEKRRPVLLSPPAPEQSIAPPYYQ